MFRAIFSLIIRSIYTVLQILVLQTYVAADWYHGSVGTAVQFQHSHDTVWEERTVVNVKLVVHHGTSRL